jgi:hypothetical protein
MPIRLGSLPYRIMNRVLPTDTPFGRTMLAAQRGGPRKGTPLVRVTADDLAKAGLQRALKATGVDELGRPVPSRASDLRAIADSVEIEALRGEYTDAGMMRDDDRFASLFI